MPNKPNISRVDSVDPEALDDMTPKVHPETLETEPDPGPMPQVELSFWNRPLGRTLRGKNTAGKTIYGLLGTGLSVLTGLNISAAVQSLTSTVTITQNQLPMHFSLITLLLGILVYGLGLLTTYGVVKGTLKDIITELREGVVQVRKAKSPESEEGSKISDHEKELIMQRAETVLITLYNRVIRKWIAGIFGNTFDKIPTDET